MAWKSSHTHTHTPHLWYEWAWACCKAERCYWSPPRWTWRCAGWLCGSSPCWRGRPGPRRPGLSWSVWPLWWKKKKDKRMGVYSAILQYWNATISFCSKIKMQEWKCEKTVVWRMQYKWRSEFVNGWLLFMFPFLSFFLLNVYLVCSTALLVELILLSASTMTTKILFPILLTLFIACMGSYSSPLGSSWSPARPRWVAALCNPAGCRFGRQESAEGSWSPDFSCWVAPLACVPLRLRWA